jgi:CSLREA domain-containing protein
MTFSNVLRRALPLAATLAVTMAGAASAATFTVNSTGDQSDANPGDGACAITGSSDCTLRAAIDEANALSGDDTINVPQGHYLPVDEYEIGAGNGAVTVNGTGDRAEVVIDGSGDDDGSFSRIFDVDDGAQLTVNHATVTGGAYEGDGAGIWVGDAATLNLNDAVVKHNVGDGDGAGVASYNGTINVNGSSIVSNHTDSVGGGIAIETGVTESGGSGALNVTDSHIDGNSAGDDGDGAGGGVYVEESSATITRSTINDNQSLEAAGGLLNEGGNVVLTQVQVDRNNSSDGPGGGILNVDSPGGRGTLSLTDADVSDNEAWNEAGGIFNLGDVTLVRTSVNRNRANDGGGGISNGERPREATVFSAAPGDSPTLTVDNSTIGDNNGDAGGNGADGGGVDVEAGSASFANSTIAENRVPFGDGGGIYVDSDAGATAVNSIVADNRAFARVNNCDGAVSSNGNNLENGTGCGFTGTGDLQNANAGLATLGDNGGPGDTFALVPGRSQAIDKVDPAQMPATDERGESRPFGAASDIGAFEYHAPASAGAPGIAGLPVIGDNTPPILTLKVPKSLTIQKLLDGFNVTVNCNESCSFNFRLFASAPTGTLHSSGYNFRLVNTKAKFGSGKRTIKIKPCVKGRKAKARTKVCRARIARALRSKPGKTFKVKLVTAAADGSRNRSYKKNFIKVHR